MDTVGTEHKEIGVQEGPVAWQPSQILLCLPNVCSLWNYYFPPENSDFDYQLIREVELLRGSGRRGMRTVCLFVSLAPAGPCTRSLGLLGSGCKHQCSVLSSVHWGWLRSPQCGVCELHRVGDSWGAVLHTERWGLAPTAGLSEMLLERKPWKKFVPHLQR